MMKTRNEIKLLYGLILAGGKSTRMKKDKSLLRYQGKTQIESAFNLLSQFCEKIFISNRKAQAALHKHKGLPQIHDHQEFRDIGPLSGILSAMTEYPSAAWLVLACDLPFVSVKTLERLIERRNQSKTATAFTSANDGLPEPLCAIYEPQGRAQLLRFFKEGITCPRKILINSNIELVEQNDKMALENVNDPQEYRKVLAIMKKGKDSQ